MQVAGLTNRGMERARNEDNCFARADSQFALLVVADGMGGHQAGNVASELAVGAAAKLWDSLDRSAPLTVENAKKMIKNMVLEANDTILDTASKDSGKRGMGTTLTVALITGNHLVVGHVGDSRAYLLTNSSIKALTTDHSLLEHLISTGEVRPEEAKGHPQRHVLTRALGTNQKIEVDITDKPLEEGFVILLCSDGLTGLVNEKEIFEAWLKEPDPGRATESLVELANARGGFDNITVVVAADVRGLKN